MSLDELEQLWAEQEGCCALTGVPLIFGTRFADEQTASLDRIDSKQGYVHGNVQWVHKDVNKAKWDKSNADFVAMCIRVAVKAGACDLTF